ncbi:uncharacterized protein PADG_12359 [Paracoccidioides brasiliensis Pb18]|uniref:Uncharacterized protein n=1 Tax=Paracoccidioides brasiliensis (strain Pb18) TaxID=502780 RepID=A0A0A0HQT7_PARBD|nr:uncharacterized protein PADG_12359 [Paracoccidioides brasiliensis Pb18]KGM91584.1 hypothetical protein PADG_12359 [Paracoccidioides brasiliensis Pb18]
MLSLFFSVNVRRRTSTPLPPTYLGNAFLAVITSLNTIKSPNRVPLTIGLVDSQPNPTDYKRGWGRLLGKVECFRVPGERGYGQIAVFPRTNDGGLEEEAMERLMSDVNFIESAELRE